MSEDEHNLRDIGEADTIVLTRLNAHLAKLEGELIEATAELIYLRQYGKDGALWSANESKDVWRDAARAVLAHPLPQEK